jgi:squalene-hopene/tetraprenyl-beta-curcumene cyclase
MDSKEADLETERIFRAVSLINAELLQKQTSQGWWEGRLSTSALSTATAVMALLKAAECSPDDVRRGRWKSLIERGVRWLASHQNSNGGWGDTVLSISNISTTMLVHGTLRKANDSPDQFVSLADRSIVQPAIDNSTEYINKSGGADAVVKRYGKDRTFSVPILTHCALAGIVDWKKVIPLPFELACIPHQLYATVRMPVVSYALPALIAIGQVIFHHQSHWNPAVRWIRKRAIAPSLRVLESIQPPNGGFLEATPLTSFVCMSLIGCGLISHPVTQRCLAFLEASVRDDGSWPIDTNLTTWVTTLSVNALASSNGALEPQLGNANREKIRKWLLCQQYRVVHPYTHAAPGGWSWTDLPGGVPDADDTPGAILALLNLRSEVEQFSDEELSSLAAATTWLLDLQNRDGGWPTFCRGWGTLPFDRSSNDLTAHALRAFTILKKKLEQSRQANAIAGLASRIRQSTSRGLAYLQKSQRADGSWLPLWFGHQFNEDDENPLYGTSRVIRALSELGQDQHPMTIRGVRWLIQNQNTDGGWSARKGLESSVEETGLALDSLVLFSEAGSECDRAASWLANEVYEGTVKNPTPIGFYFARLWYFEELYPIIFAATGLNRWMSVRRGTGSGGSA